METFNIRNEKEIFSDLEKIAESPGYIHAIAHFCFRENAFFYDIDVGVKPEDLLPQYSTERLLRTEISVLIGLAFKNGIDLTIPKLSELQRYCNETEKLLEEIHHSITPAPSDFIKCGELDIGAMEKMLSSGEMMREAIFYGGESAFHFQYRDLCLKKYINDEEFFVNEKGYTLQQAFNVIFCIEEIQNDHFNAAFEKMLTESPPTGSLLPAFTYSYEYISSACNENLDIVKKVLDSFTAHESNEQYDSIDSFNHTNAYPIIKISESEFILFQYYSLAEAFYETPFFWFLANPTYKSKALKHRGDFTENFAAERLEKVFSSTNVYKNVNIFGSGGKVAGEVDVLVTYADRAVIVQAKSKKLTISARKGNKSSLESDFEKAVQAAYDQGYSCAQLIISTDKYRLETEDGRKVEISQEIKEIYIVCLVSDHYPALFAQSERFLNKSTSEKILPPYVMDVFFLDTLTEMLDSPLHFLSYINRRAGYSNSVHASFELTVLAYHLRKNLWIEDDITLMQLGDDICADLDLAMMVRRRGIPGNSTPEGILTAYNGTFVDRLIKKIEENENTNVIDFAFLLLSFSKETIDSINKAIAEITKRAKKDGKSHDITLFFEEPSCGITIHSNSFSKEYALNLLGEHCEKRKYTSKARKWHGICLSPDNGNFRFGVTLDFEWVYSKKMGEIVRHLPKPQEKIDFSIKNKRRNKIGRNEPCPCNSGKKYKKCCL